MSYDFPASVERDIQRYAEAERLSLDAAATELIQEALRRKLGPAQPEVSEIDLKRLKAMDPGFAFFESLPSGTVEAIESSSAEIRAERFTPRVGA